LETVWWSSQQICRAKKKLASGILLPETVNKEKLFKVRLSRSAQVAGMTRASVLLMEVKVGDTVFFKKPWDEPTKLDNEEYYALSESEIIYN
jgi:co-chaperonin GroES (HSP10)